MPEKFNLTEQQGRWLLLLPAILIIVLRFFEFFQTPNSRLIERWGDGLKNYTNVWYHVEHDSSYTAFEGMNYPYGDHLVMVDGQPLLANTLKWMDRNMLDVGDYTLGTIHFAMLLSVLGACWLLYLIFRRLQLPILYAVPLAIAITFLAPQMNRMTSHYGLAQVMALPAVLYLLLRFDRRPRLWISIALMGVVLAFSLIHLYFLLLLGGAIGAFLLLRFFYHLRWRSLPGYALHATIQLIIPALLLFYWIEWTDPIEARNPNPWGFFAYRAYPEGVFTSMRMPYFRWIDQSLVDIRNLNGEARNYVGLVGGVVFLLLFFSWALARFRRAPVMIEHERRGFLNKLFISALLVLLFSFGLPFIIPGLEGLLDYTGPVRQFRSIGRFSWYFYFAINIVAFVWLYAWSRQAWRRRKGWFFAALAVLVTEAALFSIRLDVALEDFPQLENGLKLTELQIDYDDYQAVVTAPHFNLGSGNFWWEPEGFILHHTAMLGVRTGLPTTSAMLGRTALDHTLQQLQLVTPPYRRPRILDSFPDRRPLLLLWDKLELAKESDKYAHLNEASNLLFEERRLKIYELSLASFETRIRRRVARIQHEIETADTLYTLNGLQSTDSVLNFVYQPMEEGPSGRAYYGKGGRKARLGDADPLYEGPLPAMAVDSQYVLQLWFDASQPLAARTRLELEEFRPRDGQILQRKSNVLDHMAKVFDSNGWAMIEWPLRRREARSHLRVRLYNGDLGDPFISVDELLIRPVRIDLYRQAEDVLWKNNLWFPIEGRRGDTR